jgi:phosphonate transport system substrate-binding protein
MKWKPILLALFLSVAAAAAVFVLWNDGYFSPKRLTIGLVPSSQPESMVRSFEPVAAYLRQTTGYEIKVTVPDSYYGLIEAMKNKEVDIGWFGAFSYIAAQDEMPLEPVVIQERSGSGIMYHSLIVVNGASDIRSIDELKGKRFAFVDPGSTSGFVIPYSLLKSRGIEYRSFFGSVAYSGTHNAVIADVLRGKADAGAVEDLTYMKMLESGELRDNELRILWKSNSIPGSPFAARADLQPQAKKRFKEAMTAIHQLDPEALRVFDSKIQRYVDVQDSLYNDLSLITSCANDF